MAITSPPFMSLLERDDSLQIRGNDTSMSPLANLHTSFPLHIFPPYPPSNNHCHLYLMYYPPPLETIRDLIITHHLMTPQMGLILSTRITFHTTLHHLEIQITFQGRGQLYTLIHINRIDCPLRDRY